MAKVGRPPKPKSQSLWIPEELIDLVLALKAGDVMKATICFARWVDSQNKPDVN
jgi:hypothetical protein